MRKGHFAMYQPPLSHIYDYFSLQIALAGECDHSQQSELHTEPQSEQREEKLVAQSHRKKQEWAAEHGLIKPRPPRQTGSAYKSLSVGKHWG